MGQKFNTKYSVVAHCGPLCFTYSLHCPSLSSLATHHLPITKYSSCIHTSHLKQCQGTNFHGHQPLMVLAVTLAELDSFVSGLLQGCPKMAQHMFTGCPCHQGPPQATPWTRCWTQWTRCIQNAILMLSHWACVWRCLLFLISQILLGFQPSFGHIHIFLEPLERIGQRDTVTRRQLMTNAKGRSFPISACCCIIEVQNADLQNSSLTDFDLCKWCCS